MRSLLIQLFVFVGVSTASSNPLFTKPLPQDSTQRAKSVYAEYGGPSAIYSINYDTRLTRAHSGWGLRAGIGYLQSSGIHTFAIPVQVNYLLGKTRHFFEAGGGATFYHGDVSGNNWFGSPEEDRMVFGTLSVGYRYQPLAGGITARIGGTGLVGPFRQTVAAIPYLSVGYRF